MVSRPFPLKREPLSLDRGPINENTELASSSDGGVVALSVECRTCDQEVVGSSLGRARGAKTLGKFLTPMCLCSPSSISWYRPKGGDVLRLGSKGRYGLCVSALRWCIIMIKRYINTSYLLNIPRHYRDRRTVLRQALVKGHTH